MKIQIPHKCAKYTKNDNPNKTCENRFKCLIYYNEFCNEYQEKQKRYCDGIDCAYCLDFNCKWS